MTVKPLAPDDPRHGTTNGYTNRGCRCQPCKDAWAINHRAYMDRHPEQREKARKREAARWGGYQRPEGWLSLHQVATAVGVRQQSMWLLRLLAQCECVESQGGRRYYNQGEVSAAVRAHFEDASRRAVEELDRAEWEGW